MKKNHCRKAFPIRQANRSSKLTNDVLKTFKMKSRGKRTTSIESVAKMSYLVKTFAVLFYTRLESQFGVSIRKQTLQYLLTIAKF